MIPTRNRSSIIYLLLFIAIISMVVYNFQQQSTTQETLSINQVAADIQSGDVERIVEDDDRLRVIYSEGNERTSQKEGASSLVEQLKAFGVTTEQLQPDKVKLEIKAPSAWLGIATALGYILPFIILAGVFDEEADGKKFFGHKVLSYEALDTNNCDYVLLTQTEDIESHCDRLVSVGVKPECILHLRDGH